MIDIILWLGAILFGFGGLIWGSDKFVEGAATTARILSMPTLLIGLTIVALGTSAPEMLVSALASAQDQIGLAVGNAVGSNIANIAMILGITALITPLAMKSKLVWGELLAMLIATALASCLLLYDYYLSRGDGAILLLSLLPVTFWMFWLSKRNNETIDDEAIDEINEELGLNKALMILGLGLVVLLVGSQGVVWGASEFARYLNVSDAVIGATVVAIGTSLPELGATLAAARRNEPGLAIGNVVGSNLYNILAVLGIAGLVGPDRIANSIAEQNFLIVQIIIMIALSAFLALLLLRRSGNGGINRIHGAILSAIFVGFIIYSAISAAS